MSFKTIKRCADCENPCKQEVHESVWKNATVVSCGKTRKFKKKKKVSKKA